MPMNPPISAKPSTGSSCSIQGLSAPLEGDCVARATAAVLVELGVVADGVFAEFPAETRVEVAAAVVSLGVVSPVAGELAVFVGMPGALLGTSLTGWGGEGGGTVCAIVRAATALIAVTTIHRILCLCIIHSTTW